MALTLLEASKLHTGDVYRQGIIEMYAATTDITTALPFVNIDGNAYSYNREGTLPGIAFRGVNEAFTESVGIINPLSESLKIAGGDLDVDRFIVVTQGEDQRTIHEQMKLKALSLHWAKQFIKGSEASNPRQFDGLQVRIAGNQLIAAGATSGGDALSLTKLDEVIDAVDSPTHLIMNKTMRRLLTAASRSSTVGGYVTYTTDAFGRKLTQYNDLPILIADYDENNAQVLPFTEAQSGGGSAASTSIYVVSMGDGMLAGIQNDMPDARDLGELPTEPVFRTRVEWYSSFCILHGRAAARLWGIKNAAVVA